jgi:hypothetical protein
LNVMSVAVRVYFIAASRKGGVGVLGQTTKGAELKKGENSYRAPSPLLSICTGTL